MSRTGIPALSRIVCLLVCLAALCLAGCEKRVRDAGDALATVYYLKSWTYVRAEPGTKAKALAKAGPNARVTIADSREGWSKVSFDNGRVVGWVETSRLSDKPVKETGKKAAPAKTAAKPQKAKTPAASETPGAAKAAPAAGEPAAPAGTPAAPAAPAAPATPAEPAVPAAPAPAPVTEPIEAANEPAPAAEPALIILSPAEAQAATGQSEPPPAARRQAKPEAFDPF